MRSYIILIVAFIGVYGCTQNIQNKKSEENISYIDSVRTAKSITAEGLVQCDYFTMSNDNREPNSTKIYYVGESQIKTVSYNYSLSDKILSKGYFPNGKIEYIKYNNKNPQKNDTIYIAYYPSDGVSFLQTIIEDSLELP